MPPARCPCLVSFSTVAECREAKHSRGLVLVLGLAALLRIEVRGV